MFGLSLLSATAVSVAMADSAASRRPPARHSLPADISAAAQTPMIRWFAPGDLPTGIPSNAPERWTRPMDAVPILPLLDSVPGRPFFPVDPPPRSQAWVKYPVYLALGLPRDLIDGAFGVAAQIPLVNVAVVGGAYEVIPTQMLIRDQRDWHGWGGTSNRKGHGWIRSKGWGWFPTANSMEFSYESKWKLRRNKRRNEKLLQELIALNLEIANHNSVVAERQSAVRAWARFELSRANGREAVDWILPYHLAYPADAEAHGLLLTSLALAAGQGSVDWAQPFLWSELAQVSPAVLHAAQADLTALIDEYPMAWTSTQALCLALTRLGKADEALGVARRAFDLDPAHAGRARLLVEAAIQSFDAEEAYRGLEALTRVASLGVSALPMVEYEDSNIPSTEELNRLGIRVAEAVGPNVASRRLIAGPQGDRLRRELVELKLRRDDLRMTFVRTSNPMNEIDRHIARVEKMLETAAPDNPEQSADLPNDPVVAHLREKLLDLKLEEVDIGLRYRTGSAPMADVRRRIKNVEKLLAYEIELVGNSVSTNP